MRVAVRIRRARCLIHFPCGILPQCAKLSQGYLSLVLLIPAFPALRCSVRFHDPNGAILILQVHGHGLTLCIFRDNSNGSNRCRAVKVMLSLRHDDRCCSVGREISPPVSHQMLFICLIIVIAYFDGRIGYVNVHLNRILGVVFRIIPYADV